MQHSIIGWILIGLVAGSLAGRLTGVRAGGCFMTTLIGLAGALVGGAVMRRLSDNDGYGFIASTVIAFVFAAIFLGVLRALGLARPRGIGSMVRRR